MPTQETYPSWCDRRHLAEPGTLDPVHECYGPVLAGVTRVIRSTPGDEPIIEAHASEIRPVLFSSATTRDETWLAVELGEHGPGVTLTAETWRRVVPEVVALLRLLEPSCPDPLRLRPE